MSKHTVLHTACLWQRCLALCFSMSAAYKAMWGPSIQASPCKEILSCLVSAQVNAFPSIWPSLREYFGVLMVTWYHWLMLIAPHRAPLSLLQQAKANPAAIIILKIIPQKWSHHWIIQLSSLVRTLLDSWHHSSWIPFSRCVSQNILKQESHSQNIWMILNKVSNSCFLKLCVISRKCLTTNCNRFLLPWSGFATKPQSGLICTAM